MSFLPSLRYCCASFNCSCVRCVSTFINLGRRLHCSRAGDVFSLESPGIGMLPSLPTVVLHGRVVTCLPRRAALCRLRARRTRTLSERLAVSRQAGM